MDKSKPTPNSKTNSKSIDDNFFTDEDYQFLLDDIEEAIAEGNKKYGYGEPGYIDRNGNYYPFPDNNKPRNFARAIPKVNPMPPMPRTSRRRIEEPGPLLEEVMLARGLLHAVKVKRRSLNRNE
jgi:hypothetical protein